jgi:predicted DCC family thiol-disulfide oxidoreductase YuxK
VTPAETLDGVRPRELAGPETTVATGRAPTAAPPPSSGVPVADRLVVLFDRDCGLCTASARALRRWDRAGRLELLALQDATSSPSPVIAAAGRALPLAAALHVIDPSTGEVHPGGDAILAIAAALPGGGVVRPLGAIAPYCWALRAGYEVVARNRHRIGRWLRLEGPSCDVPR